MKKYIIIGLISLFVGLGFGYALGTESQPTPLLASPKIVTKIEKPNCIYRGCDDLTRVHICHGHWVLVDKYRK